jgi:predicted Zn-dependent peptidase
MNPRVHARPALPATQAIRAVALLSLVALAAGPVTAAERATAPSTATATAIPTATTPVPATPRREAPPPLGTPRDFQLPAKTEFALDNGVGVTFVPFGTVPKATVMVVVRTGNIDDPKTGVADLVGEMLKEGAAGRSAADVARFAAEMGGSLDVSVGADQTTVALDVLGERAPEAIALAADVLRRPTLPASELPRLKANIALQVAVARSSPQAIAGEAYARLLWGDHPYGRALPTDADIESYSLDDVREFHARNFGAARTHVYVAGRFDPAAVEAAVRTAFADWAPGAPPTVNPPTGTRTAQVQLIDRPDAAQSTILLGGPTIGPTAPEYLPLVVTNTLLGGGLISRLDQNLREEKGWTYGVATRISPSYRAASWTMSADVNTPDTAPALRETYREIAKLQAEPPSVAELERIQNYRAGTFVIGSSSRGGLLGQLAFLDLHGLPDEWLTDYVKNVYAVTPEQVSAAARQHVDPASMTLVVVGDLKQVGKDVSALPQVKASARK